MHHAAWRFVELIARRIGPVAHALEIGSRNINGSVRSLITAGTYLGVDLVDGDGVDVVADGATYEPPAPFTPLDLVVCCEVLEHAPNADAIVRHALTLVRPHGHLVITAAAPDRAPHSAVDGGALRSGEHYQNIDPDALETWVHDAGGRVILSTHAPTLGDVYLWAEKR